MSQDGAGSSSTSSEASQKPDEAVPKFDWQKKATLIFLGSIGVTLLLTGATGSRMIKKPPSVTPRSPSTTTLNPAGPSTSKSAASAPPFAFVKRIPGTSTPPRRSSSRLRQLFQTSPAPISPLNFVANEHVPWKKELPTPILVGAMVDAEEAAIPEPAPEDKANALLDAIKAFALATTITVGSAAAGVYFLSRYLGADDIPTFMHELREQVMQPFARSVAGSDFLPNFMKLKEKPRTAESIRSEQEDEEELRQIFERGWRDLLKQTGQTEDGNSAVSTEASVLEIRKG